MSDGDSIIVMVIMFFCVMIGVYCGEDMGKNKVREEAIKRGYGTWNVINESGKTEFKWKDTNEQTKR